MGIVAKISCWVATLGPIGYLPAPGTWGTLCSAVVMYALYSSFDEFLVDVFCMFSAVISAYAIHYALPQFDGQHDPSQIVIDEFVGFAVLACVIPLDPILYIAGFFLFRFFDVLKPLGIKKVEQFSGALGIMGDDLVAAGYAGICVLILKYVLT